MYEEFAMQNNAPAEDMLSEQGKEDIKRVEGILTEAYRRKYGHFPPWKCSKIYCICHNGRQT